MPRMAAGKLGGGLHIAYDSHDKRLQEHQRADHRLEQVEHQADWRDASIGVKLAATYTPYL